MAQLSENEIRLLKTDWPIIAMFGLSGTGKSSFINLIAQEQQKVEQSIDSCTQKVTLLEAKINDKSVVLVDTPGVDNTRPGMTEADVLTIIARSLEVTGRKNRWVTGILYLHRISDPRFTPTAQRISAMLKSLCGDDRMNRVMFCTTMWDLPSDDFKRRQVQLCNAPALKTMISNGARTVIHSNRWDNAKKNAETILSDLIDGLKPGSLAIQNEMINEGKTAGQTRAGQVVMEDLAQQRTRIEEEIIRLRQEMAAATQSDWATLAKALAEQEHSMTELKRQERELSRRDAEAKCCIIC